MKVWIRYEAEEAKATVYRIVHGIRIPVHRWEGPFKDQAEAGDYLTGLPRYLVEARKPVIIEFSEVV